MKHKTVNGWTKEKMIEHVKKEFKGKSTSTKGNGCYYRNIEGKKCAIGMFMSDDVAQAADRLSETDIATVLRAMPDIKTSMPLSDIRALKDLQCVHDNAETDLECFQNILKYIEENVYDHN